VTTEQTRQKGIKELVCQMRLIHQHNHQLVPLVEGKCPEPSCRFADALEARDTTYVYCPRCTATIILSGVEPPAYFVCPRCGLKIVRN